MSWRVFQAYRVSTIANRECELLFRGTTKNGRRLWFTELDAPYGDVFLKPNQIREAIPIGGQR